MEISWIYLVYIVQFDTILQLIYKIGCLSGCVDNELMRKKENKLNA